MGDYIVMNIFIGCSKEKLKTSARAKDIYTGTSFRYSWGYAEGMKKKNDNVHVWILSAKHHLLNPNKTIAPYNQYLHDFGAEEKKEWAEKCLASMKLHRVNFDDESIFLCGSEYYENLIDQFPNHKLPLKDLQMGDGLHKIKNMCHRVNPDYKFNEDYIDLRTWLTESMKDL